MTRYKLENVIADIKNKVSNITVTGYNKLQKEYQIYNIFETDIINTMKFEFIGKSSSGYPIYRLGNIECVFIEDVLHIYEWVL